MIEIKNVSKKYDDIYALSGVSFDMPDGQVFGLVGTNGAGKVPCSDASAVYAGRTRERYS